MRAEAIERAVLHGAAGKRPLPVAYERTGSARAAEELVRVVANEIERWTAMTTGAATAVRADLTARVAKASPGLADCSCASLPIAHGPAIHDRHVPFDFERGSAGPDGHLWRNPLAGLAADGAKESEVQLQSPVWGPFPADCLADHDHDHWNSCPVYRTFLPACSHGHHARQVYGHAFRSDTAVVAVSRDDGGSLRAGETMADVEHALADAKVADENDYPHIRGVRDSTGAANRGVPSNSAPDHGDQSSKCGDAPNRNHSRAKTRSRNQCQNLKTDPYKPCPASRRIRRQGRSWARK